MQLSPFLQQSIHTAGSLRSRPDYALELAEIASRSAPLEHWLVLAFAAVTRIPYLVAEKAIHSMTNMQQKIAALRNMADDFSPTEDFRQSIVKLLDRARKLSSRRATYIHGYWIVRGDGRVTLLRHTEHAHSAGRERHVPISDMRKLVDELGQACADLETLIAPLRPLVPLDADMEARRRPR